MCGRYQIDEDPRVWLKADLPGFHSRLAADWRPRYNVAPSQQVPVVRAGAEAAELVMMRWGFVPHFVKEETPKIQPINAKAETAPDKPFFREAARQRRCILPASGFYEWQKRGSGPKQPYFIHRRDAAQPLYMAGLWDSWGGEDRVAILTCQANALMAPIHHRQPVLLTAHQLAPWLAAWHDDFVAPFDSEALQAVPISTAINNPGRDTSEIFQPLEDPPEGG